MAQCTVGEANSSAHSYLPATTHRTAAPFGQKVRNVRFAGVTGNPGHG